MVAIRYSMHSLRRASWLEFEAIAITGHSVMPLDVLGHTYSIVADLATIQIIATTQCGYS